VGADELNGRRVAVVGSGLDEACGVPSSEETEGMEGADCADYEGEEQAVLLIDDSDGTVTVVQPNEDGSYWRKIVRNKMIRMKEKRREQAAAAYALQTMEDELSKRAKVVSSWGPYTSTVGTATKTGVKSLAEIAKAVAK
jgi:hypothetical protein